MLIICESIDDHGIINFDFINFDLLPKKKNQRETIFKHEGPV